MLLVTNFIFNKTLVVKCQSVFGISGCVGIEFNLAVVMIGNNCLDNY